MIDGSSQKRLIGVCDPLQRVVRRAFEIAAAQGKRFMVIEGLRRQSRQDVLLKAGKTWTSNSRHLTGHAVDLAPLLANGQVPRDKKGDWDRDAFVELSKLVFQAADELGILIQWGGDWDMDGQWRDESKFDGPHFQIPWPHNEAKAREAQKARAMLGRFLSADITPGLTPENMSDAVFEPEADPGLDL